jgi:hypothetical protein
MESRAGCLSWPWGYFSKSEELHSRRSNERPKDNEVEVEKERDVEIVEIEAPMMVDVSATTSVEVFAMPGHGRTSFLWAMLFMLRQLSRVWPGYVCWPLDEPTGSSLLEIHQMLRQGLLPKRWTPEGGQHCRHALHLRNMNPWGDQRFVIWDWPDTVFCPERLASTPETKPIDWNLPALWLLSLSDLDDVQGRFLDLTLDNLVQVRYASGEAAREIPFRLIIVLTKGDAITDLPKELRCFLKEDPLAKALSTGPSRLFRAHDELDLSASHVLGGQETYPEGDPLNAYFEARKLIDDLTRDWMSSNSAGRALLGRADDLGIELRFSVVSATGSGFESGGRLATAWSPRRVLDPYFWSLEMSL